MKVRNLIILVGIVASGVSFGATGIWGAYVTVGGLKYKSSSTYGGLEATFDGANLGSFTVGSGPLYLSQAETLTYQNNGHSTFQFALAYRVRLASSAQSTNPLDYAFISMGDGVAISGGDEKGEFSGATINLLSGLTTAGIYAVDIIHKVEAWEGGTNFERLGNVNNPNPGSTNWGSTDAFTANFTVVPEPSAAALGLIGSFALLLRRRM